MNLFNRNPEKSTQKSTKEALTLLGNIKTFNREIEHKNPLSQKDHGTYDIYKKSHSKLAKNIDPKTSNDISTELRRINSKLQTRDTK